MAAETRYGVEHTNTFQSAGAARQNSAAAVAGGRVRAVVDTYVSAGDEGVGSTIWMGGIQIPAGAKLVGWTIDHEDFGGTATMTISVVGDATIGISGAIDVSSAGIARSEANLTSVFAIVGSASKILLTTGGSTLVTTKSVSLTVKYTID